MANKKKNSPRTLWKLLALVLSVCLLSGCVTWPTEIRNEEIALQTVSLVDMTETLRIADNPFQFREVNPLLGNHPSPGRVVGYFALSSAIHIGVTELMIEHNAPMWALRTWELGGIGWELRCLSLNKSHGISPTLSFHVNINQH